VGVVEGWQAIGAGIAVAMTIVTSAPMSDHQNHVHPLFLICYATIRNNLCMYKISLQTKIITKNPLKETKSFKIL
jgi:hypothetical protein